MSFNETYLRNKVWEILNLMQANQLYVHSSMFEVPINLTEMEKNDITLIEMNEKFAEKIKNYYEKSTQLNNEPAKIDNEENKETDTKGTKKRRIKKSEKVTTIELPEILTISILNAIVPNSAMLLIGGHGGGKSTLVKHLGRMFTAASLNEIEEGIIRAHPQLTEEKIVARLKFDELIHEGKEEVKWAKFIECFWKILDEVNRLSPYTQNILLSMLAEGRVKYYDSVYPVDKYVLYATLNPGGSGTFEMGAPFLDRFGISVYITMPTSYDLDIILGSVDDKLVGYDEFMQVPSILNTEQLLSIWFAVDKIKMDLKAENFIHSIIREFTLCDRIDKGNSFYLTPETGLCNECHFNTKNVVCNKVNSILSVRAAKDLQRYSKALAWLMGFKEVTVDIVKSIAPYIISHRAIYPERELNTAPYWGNKFKFTVNLIDIAYKRFINREECYEIVNKFVKGEGTKEDLTKIDEYKNSDLIVKNDLIPLINSLNRDDYKSVVKLIKQFYDKQNIEKLIELKEDLMQNLSFPNRGQLINQISNYLKELSKWSRTFIFKRWAIVLHSIASLYPQFSEMLEETTKSICTKQLRDRNLFLEINVTGTDPLSPVQIECHGGKEAIELKNILESKYPEKEYNFETELHYQEEELKMDDLSYNESELNAETSFIRTSNQIDSNKYDNKKIFSDTEKKSRRSTSSKEKITKKSINKEKEFDELDEIEKEADKILQS